VNGGDSLLWNAVSGSALAAVIVALLMIVVIVVRLVREARATGTTRHKMPVHILLVGTGSAIWGVGLAGGVLDYLGVRFPEWATVATALAGALVLHVGLWKMIEVQRVRYRTLGGPGDPVVEDAGAPNLPRRVEERISRLYVEARVLFALAFVGLIFGFAQTATVTHEACTNNNEQDKILKTLALSLENADPVRAKTRKGREGRREFEAALKTLDPPQDCPAKGI